MDILLPNKVLKVLYLFDNYQTYFEDQSYLFTTDVI